MGGVQFVLTQLLLPEGQSSRAKVGAATTVLAIVAMAQRRDVLVQTFIDHAAADDDEKARTAKTAAAEFFMVLL